MSPLDRDLRLSKNRYNDKLFPNFADVLREINTVMDESEYSGRQQR